MFAALGGFCLFLLLLRVDKRHAVAARLVEPRQEDHSRGVLTDSFCFLTFFSWLFQEAC